MAEREAEKPGKRRGAGAETEVSGESLSLADLETGGRSTDLGADTLSRGSDVGRAPTDIEDGDRSPRSREAAREGTGGLTGRLRSGLGRLTAPVRSRLASLFSPGSYLVGCGAALVGLLAIGGLLPLGGVGDILGIGAGTFGYGLAIDTRHYLEVAAAGATVAGAWAVLGNLLLTLLGVGVPLVAAGAVGGALGATLGYYFGRDLRDGLTRDL
jgi:hypothetical protein